LTAQRFVIACICITRNKLDMSCNALKYHSCFIFIAQSLVIACISKMKNNLDMSCNAMIHIIVVLFS